MNKYKWITWGFGLMNLLYASSVFDFGTFNMPSIDYFITIFTAIYLFLLAFTSEKSLKGGEHAKKEKSKN